MLAFVWEWQKRDGERWDGQKWQKYEKKKWKDIAQNNRIKVYVEQKEREAPIMSNLIKAAAGAAG